MHHDDRHPHGPSSPAGPPTPREKLRIRLEHALRHSVEHGVSYRELALEAERLGEREAARRLQALEGLSAEQARALEEALAALGGP